MIKQMAMECIIMLMAHDMKDTGKTIYKKAMVWKSGRMDPNMMGITRKDRSMDRALSLGMMVRSMKEPGTTTRSMVRYFFLLISYREFIVGRMVDNTRAPGLITRCRVKGYTNGKTGECMKASTREIRSMASEYTGGRTGGFTRAAGRRGSSTGRGNTSTRRAKSDWACGKAARESGGSKKSNRDGKND